MSVDTDKARERAAYLRDCASPGDSEEAATLIETLASEVDALRALGGCACAEPEIGHLPKFACLRCGKLEREWIADEATPGASAR